MTVPATLATIGISLVIASTIPRVVYHVRTRAPSLGLRGTLWVGALIGLMCLSTSGSMFWLQTRISTEQAPDAPIDSTAAQRLATDLANLGALFTTDPEKRKVVIAFEARISALETTVRALELYYEARGTAITALFWVTGLTFSATLGMLLLWASSPLRERSNTGAASSGNG